MRHASTRGRPFERGAMLHALGPALSLLLLGAGCGSPTVVRVVDGVPVEGRYIPPEAYAAYAHAAEAEARGRHLEAIALYARAAAEDPEGAEALTRLGAVRCARAAVLARQGRGADAARAREQARTALAEAEERDPAYEPLWRERARCATDPAAAVAASSRAVFLDPEREETVLVHAAALSRAGRGEEAMAWLEELAAKPRPSDEALRAIAEAARARSDETLARAAVSRIASAPRAGAGAPPPRAGLSAVDAALTAADLRGARRHALEARVPPGELAARAAALGRPDLARVQADLVLGAEPGNLTAHLARAAALDLLGDLDALSEALAALPAPSEVSTPPSRLARLLFARVVERHVGPGASRMALGDLRLDQEGPDPLENDLARRLRRP